MSEKAEQNIEDIFYPPENSEPQSKPTETQGDELPEETEESENETEQPDDSDSEENKESESEESEESESDDEEDNNGDDNDESLVYEIEGEEYTLADIKAKKSERLKQADYTQKTQILAEERKVFESERESVSQLRDVFNEKIAALEAVINEDIKTDEDIAEMKELYPEDFIEYQEKIEKRKKLVSEAKITPNSNVDIAQEKKKMWAANPTWGEEDKRTKAFDNDMKLVAQYAEKIGWSQDEISSIAHAHHWQALIDASKFNANKSKISAAAKKVRKAPKATKPKKGKVKVKTAEETFYPTN